MESPDKHLTPTEWHLMECLWAHSPRTGREAVAYMAQSVGWSRSTTLTMLRRMSEKGLIQCQDCDGIKTYTSRIPREEAVRRETDSFLSRVYRGSVSTLVNALTQKQRLSQEEIDALYAIIRSAEQEQQP